MKTFFTVLLATLWLGVLTDVVAAHDTPPEGPIGNNGFQESDINKIHPLITILRRNTPPTSFGESATSYALYPLNGVVAENLTKCSSSYTTITTQMICYAEIWADGCSFGTDVPDCGSQAAKTDVAETSPAITCDTYLANTYGCVQGNSYTYRPNFNSRMAGRGCSGAKALWTAGAPDFGTGSGTGMGYLDVAGIYGYSTSNIDTPSGYIWDNETAFISAANAGSLDAILQFDGTYITTGGCDTGSCKELSDSQICVFPPARLADASMTQAGVRFDWEVGDGACDDQSNCAGDITATDYFVDLISDDLAYWAANGCGGSGCQGANLSLLMDDLFGVNAPSSGLTATSLSTILNHGEIHKLFIQMSQPSFRMGGSATTEWNDQLGEVFNCPSACSGNPDPATNDPRLANIALIFGLTGESGTTSNEVNAILLTWGIDTMDMWPNNSTQGGELLYPDINGIACSPAPHVFTLGWTPLVNERQILAMGYPPVCSGEDAYF